MKKTLETPVALALAGGLVAAALFLGDVGEEARTFTVAYSRGTSVSDDGAVAVARAASILKGDPRAEARVTGHTWPGADPGADATLARQRADFTVGMLHSEGVETDRARVAEDGHQQPLAGGCDAGERACRLRHARAEITITRRTP